MSNTAPRHLIRGRDGAFGPAFTRRIRAMEIRDRPTAPRSQRQNGHVERHRIDTSRITGPPHRVRRSSLARCPEGLRFVLQKREADLDASGAAAPKMARDDAQILAELDAANVSRALVTGFDEASTAGKTFVTNDCFAVLTRRHPIRFIPFAGIDISGGGGPDSRLQASPET